MNKLLKSFPRPVFVLLTVSFVLGYLVYILAVCYSKLAYRRIRNYLREKYNIGNKVYDTDFSFKVETRSVDKFKVSPSLILPREFMDDLEKDLSIAANVYVTKHYIFECKLLDKSVYFEFDGPNLITSSKIIHRDEMLNNNKESQLVC